MIIYAIGDIHGQKEMLADALDWIDRDAGGRAHRVIFLGDFIDRGPASSIVIQTLISGIEAGRPWHAIKGNHDVRLGMFKRDVNAIELNGPTNKHWLHKLVGGAATLRSYGINPDRPLAQIAEEVDLIADRHVDWLDSLPDFLHWGQYFFVHAGVRPNVPLGEQDPMDMRWIRHDFLNFPRFDHGALIVHGHTPVEMMEHGGNHINCDLGAGYGREIGVVALDDGRAFAVDAQGRRYLAPPAGWGDNGRPIALLG